MTAKVAINGYGTIGKRVADAIAAQDDMEVVGVTKTRPTFEARMAVSKGFSLYVASEDNVASFKDAGIDVSGTLRELLEESDLVIDGTPKRSGYKEAYEEAGVKAIWQGGEKHDLTNFSFNSQVNYEDALGIDYLRVPSCNTTGLIRTLYPLHVAFGLEEVLAVMVRRAADPWDSRRGPINAIEPVLRIPSHHGPDVQSVLTDLNIQTIAVKVPTTIMHVHTVTARMRQPATVQEVLDIWRKSPRIKLVRGADGIESTAQVMEMARDLGRPRSDLFEIVVWEDGVNVEGDSLYYFQAVHQEADVVPENVDAIRAMMELESNKRESIRKTDLSLGIPSPF